MVDQNEVLPQVVLANAQMERLNAIKEHAALVKFLKGFVEFREAVKMEPREARKIEAAQNILRNMRNAREKTIQQAVRVIDGRISE